MPVYDKSITFPASKCDLLWHILSQAHDTTTAEIPYRLLIALQDQYSYVYVLTTSPERCSLRFVVTTDATAHLTLHDSQQLEQDAGNLPGEAKDWAVANAETHLRRVLMTLKQADDHEKSPDKAKPKTKTPDSDVFFLTFEAKRFLDGNYSFISYVLFYQKFNKKIQFTGLMAATITLFLFWFSPRMRGSSVLVVLSLILVAVWIIWLMFVYQDYQHAKSNGQIIYGNILRNVGRKEIIQRSRNHKEEIQIVTVEYEFTTPAGRLIRASASAERDDLSRHTLPKEGRVAILYISDNDYNLL